jgi:hypothetical protein
MPAHRPLHDKPFGAEDFDSGALDEIQQEKLNQRKVGIRSVFNQNETRTDLF